MKQVVITGERQCELRDFPDPSPKDDWVVVRIDVAPMCTEYKMWLGGHRAEHLGHEAVGTVAAVAQPGKVAVGQRVVVHPQTPCGTCELCVRGDYIHCEHCVSTRSATGNDAGWATYSQYIVKPDWLCCPIPDDVTSHRAGLALCALGPSFGAFHRMRVSAFDTLLITGLGPVGLGGVVNGVFRGARVLAVESNPWRAAKARELGATDVFDPADEATPARIRELTKGRGVDAALDCSGSPQAHRLLINAARRGGQVAFVGESGGETVLKVSDDMLRKGLTLHGCWHYNLSLYPRVMQVIRQFPDIDRLISHVFPMTQAQTAFETLAGQETAKVLLEPWA